MIDFRVETFLTACEYMNYTKAAGVLHITQPAVTQHIRYLEGLYGTKLFLCEGRKLKLTEAGKMLYRAAKTVKHDDMHLKEQMEELKVKTAKLEIGATRTIGEFLLPDILGGYMDSHPDTKLRLIVSNTRELLHSLDEGRIDCALIEGFFDKNSYDSLVYSREPFIGICKAGSPLAGREVTLEELFGERLLVREEGSGSREILYRYLESSNYTWKDFRRVCEVGDIPAIKRLVECGCGISFLYRAACRRELEEGRLACLRVKGFSVKHDFTFVWQKGSLFEAHYRRLYRELRKAAG